MTEKIISYRYAKALLDLAVNEKLSDQIYYDFSKVEYTFKMSRELRSLTASPVFQIYRKRKIYQELFKEEGISDFTLNFLLLTIDKRRGELIPSIIKQYNKLYDELNNRLNVQITSAIELTDTIKEKVLNKLKEWTQKTILPEFKIDTTIKGGIVLKIEDWVFDASIKNQLENLYQELALSQAN